MLLSFEFVPQADAAVSTHIGDISLSHDYATNGTEIDITVTDLDLRESIARDSESLDASGQAFSIPPGGIGQTFDVTFALASVADQDGDGVIGPAEFTISITEAEIIGVSTTTSSMTVQRVGPSSSDLNYTIGTVLEIIATSDLEGTPYILTPGLKGFSEFHNLPTVPPTMPMDQAMYRPVTTRSRPLMPRSLSWISIRELP